MFGKLISTQDDVAPLVMRVMLGVVFFPHGAQKVLGWFGGHGLEGFLTDNDVLAIGQDDTRRCLVTFHVGQQLRSSDVVQIADC